MSSASEANAPSAMAAFWEVVSAFLGSSTFVAAGPLEPEVKQALRGRLDALDARLAAVEDVPDIAERRAIGGF
jgi:hypothetical protein